MWEQIWLELRKELAKQPHCEEHPTLPCVRTLIQRVTNDIIEIAETRIRVRSHRTNRIDDLPAERFECWWDYLQKHGSASLKPGDPNNPHRWRSRVVGAILAACLPKRVRFNPVTDELLLASR